MASGNAVIQDPGIWDRLRRMGARRLMALEMEGATIATVAHQQQVPHWLVAKGVMDRAELDRDDRFREFAARASAEVLFDLLGRLLPARGNRPRDSTPVGRMPAPIPGTVKVEIVRRLTYDWRDLADLVGVPSFELRRFSTGDEPRALWHWLEARGRLGDLGPALGQLGRDDLAALLRPYIA
jgi:hypothetical protein